MDRLRFELVQVLQRVQQLEAKVTALQGASGDLTQFYTKSQVDSLIANIEPPDTSAFVTGLAVNTMLEPYARTEDITSYLNATYLTAGEIGTVFIERATALDVFPTKEFLDQALIAVTALIPDVSEKLGVNDLNNALVPYATTAYVSAVLQPYATQEGTLNEINTALQVALQPYKTDAYYQVQWPATLQPYLKLADLNGVFYTVAQADAKFPTHDFLENHYWDADEIVQLISNATVPLITVAQSNANLNAAISALPIGYTKAEVDTISSSLGTAITNIDTRLFSFDARRIVSITIGDLGSSSGQGTTNVAIPFYCQLSGFITGCFRRGATTDSGFRTIIEIQWNDAGMSLVPFICMRNTANGFANVQNDFIPIVLSNDLDTNSAAFVLEESASQASSVILYVQFFRVGSF